MRVDEIFESMARHGGGRIDHMAGEYVPNEKEDGNGVQYKQAADSVNIKKRSIRKKIEKVRHRNKPWTIEQRMDASPTTGEHDLGQTDAALAGVMNGKNPYPGHQGI